MIFLKSAGLSGIYRDGMFASELLTKGAVKGIAVTGPKQTCTLDPLTVVASQAPAAAVVHVNTAGLY